MVRQRKRTKIAILGGGCGAISTAFWLTSTPELRNRYQVSVYTHGWRLGGKGASGRDRKENDRILEHGLHMWMGFYECAFRTIRECYAQWRRDPDNPLRSWREAFTPLRQLTLAERIPGVVGGAWQNWTLKFPRLPGTPSEPFHGFGFDIAGRILTWLEERLRAAFNLSAETAALTRSPFFTIARGFNSAENGANGDRTILYKYLSSTLVTLQRAFRRYGEPLLRRLPSQGYASCALADIALAATIGFLRDVCPYGEAGFARINEVEFKDWLISHGASRDYVWSALVRSLYDLGFAYENGDSSSARTAKVAAGVALKVLLLTLAGYKDAPLWKMNGGMGDMIFAPLYRVLVDRGVSFDFFHRVIDLRLSETGDRIERIDFARQVNLAGHAYDPLIKVKGIDCWPSEPLWPQIAGVQSARTMGTTGTNFESVSCTHSAGKRKISVSDDFDVVVLAIPPAGWRYFGKQLLQRCDSMAAAFQNMSWVATRSAQIWLRSDFRELGWTRGPTVATGYDDPYSSRKMRKTWPPRTRYSTSPGAA